MDKEKILEVHAKKNNDEYLLSVSKDSTRISNGTMLLLMAIVVLMDVLKGENQVIKYLFIVIGGNFASTIYKYVKLKSKKDIYRLIFESIMFVIAIVGMILIMIK